MIKILPKNSIINKLILDRITIKQNDTLWNLCQHAWKDIYDADYNSQFRTINPNPETIKIGSKLNLPAIKIKKNNGRIVIKGRKALGDSICHLPILRFFKEYGYETCFVTNSKWIPFFQIVPCIDETLSEMPELNENNNSLFTKYGLKIKNPPFYKEILHERSLTAFFLNLIGLNCNSEIKIKYTPLFKLPKKTISIVVGSFSKDRRIHPNFIKKIYKQLSKNYHPIIIGNCKDTKENYKELNYYHHDYIYSYHFIQAMDFLSQSIVITPDCGLMHLALSISSKKIILLEDQYNQTTGYSIISKEKAHKIDGNNIMESNNADGNNIMEKILFAITQESY